MTKKKAITDAELKDRWHARKLLRAEAERADPTTGMLDSEFSQPEIGEVIGLRKNTVNDMEASALKKVRIGLAEELGLENLDDTDGAVGKLLIRHMAQDRQKQIHTQQRLGKAAADLPAKMFIDDLKRMHAECGTAATLKELRDQLDVGGLDDWIQKAILEFIDALPAEESGSE